MANASAYPELYIKRLEQENKDIPKRIWGLVEEHLIHLAAFKFYDQQEITMIIINNIKNDLKKLLAIHYDIGE